MCLIAFIAKGIVLKAPTATRGMAMAFRFSLATFAEASKPIPAPSMPRVIAIIPS